MRRARIDREEFDIAYEKRIVVPKQRIHRADEFGNRTTVDAKRERRLGLAARAQIRLHIGAAKSVDRLLRIADEIARLCTVRVNRLENSILQRIGVLELVDQRGGIACAQRSGERGIASHERCGKAARSSCRLGRDETRSQGNVAISCRLAPGS